MEPAHPKIDPQIFAAAAATRGQDVPVIVMFGDGDQMRAYAAGGTRGGADRIRQQGTYLPYAATRVRRSEVTQLAANPAVQAIWHDALCTTCLDSATARIGLPVARSEFGVYGDSVLIGFADTGLDEEHVDFEGRVEGVRDFTASAAKGDPDGHGTHVASTACGSGAASDGRYMGVAPRAHIMSARVLGQGGAGRMSQVMAGLEWLAANDTRIINLSVGTDTRSMGEDPLMQLCNRLVQSGITVVVAAGNTGPHYRTIGSPGSARLVITVGATDRDDRVATFSSRGPTVSGLLKPDLLAPGHNIVAARARGSTLGEIVDQHYASMSGTSMAAPMIAGLSALMHQLQPGITPAEIKALQQLCCVPLNQPATVQGAGRVDAYASLQAFVPAPAPVPQPAMPPDSPQAETPRVEEPAAAAPMGCLSPRLARLMHRARLLPTEATPQ